MNSLRRVTRVVCALGFLAGCQGAGDTALVAPQVHPLVVKVTPSFGTITYCQKIPARVDVQLFDGSTVFPDSSRWTSNDSAITVAPNGVLHTQARGSPADTLRVTVWVGTQTGVAQAVWVIQGDLVLYIGPDGKPVKQTCQQGW